MKKWITNLFANGDAEAQAAVQAESSRAQHQAEVGVAFWRWLAQQAGVGGGAPGAGIVTERLAALARSPADAGALVPRVPELIPQLLRSLRDEDISGSDLARQVTQDTVLTAEVIREANSPYFGPSTPVRTVEGAVMMLGQNGLRMLLARLAFRPIISTQPGRLARLLAPRVWSQSETCALAASLLAPGLEASAIEAYLAGLMQNLGLVVALRLMDEASPAGLPALSDESCVALLDAARTLSAGIAQEWDFPPGVAQAIADAGGPDAPPLAQALALGDMLARLRVMVDAGRYDAGDPFVLEGLDSFQRRCFDKLNRE